MQIICPKNGIWNPSINPEMPDDFNLFLFGDAHTGSLMFHEKGWKKLVDMMRFKYEGLPAKKNFGVDHGDLIEAIAIDDKRFELATTKITSILQQAAMAKKIRVSIRKKLIVILKGNHEHKIIRFGNYAKKIAADLGVPYGTFSCVINYGCFKHYATHGDGTIKSKAHPQSRRIHNQKLMLMQKLSDMFGDCVLNSMGHTHKLIVHQPESIPYLTTEDGKIKGHRTTPKKVKGYIEPNHKWFVNTGSLMKLFVIGEDGYAERAGYDPIELGFAVVLVRDRKIYKIKREWVE